MSKKSSHSIADRLAAGLKSLGFTEVVPSPSKKYRKFHKVGMRTYWVGKKGALRCGDSANGSWSMGCPGDEMPTFRKVLAEGDLALGPMLPAELKETLAASGVMPSDIATLETLAASDPLLARALGNL